MTFSAFEKQIVKITNLPLPGEEVQHRMAPLERIAELKKIAIDKNTARRAGVMALFYPNAIQETYFVLILRKTYKGVHSAQVGFPGGKLEPQDNDIQETALRETEEEVGVCMNDIEVLKKLTQIYIPPSDFFVQPFLGITKSQPIFVAQEEEVEAIIEVPLTHFMDDSVLISKTLSTSYATEIEVPAYELNGHVVWGATAMMLSEVRELLKQLL